MSEPGTEQIFVGPTGLVPLLFSGFDQIWKD
jgi:hypothetical protein